MKIPEPMLRILYLLIILPCLCTAQTKAVEFTLKANYIIDKKEKEMYLSKNAETILVKNPKDSTQNYLIAYDSLYSISIKNNEVRYDSSSFQRGGKDGKISDIIYTGETETVSGIKSEKILLKGTTRTYEIFVAKKHKYNNIVQLRTFFILPPAVKIIKGLITKVNILADNKSYTLTELVSTEKCMLKLNVDRKKLQNIIRINKEQEKRFNGIIVYPEK